VDEELRVEVDSPQALAELPTVDPRPPTASLQQERRPKRGEGPAARRWLWLDRRPSNWCA